MQGNEQHPEGVRVVEPMLHEDFAAGNADVVDELRSPDLVEHRFGRSGRGPVAIAKVKRGIGQVHRGFPDLAFRVEGWAERDGVVRVPAEASGTNSGPFLGPPPGGPSGPTSSTSPGWRTGATSSTGACRTASRS